MFPPSRGGKGSARRRSHDYAGRERLPRHDRGPAIRDMFRTPEMDKARTQTEIVTSRLSAPAVHALKFALDVPRRYCNRVSDISDYFMNENNLFRGMRMYSIGKFFSGVLRHSKLVLEDTSLSVPEIEAYEHVANTLFDQRLMDWCVQFDDRFIPPQYGRRLVIGDFDGHLDTKSQYYPECMLPLRGDNSELSRILKWIPLFMTILYGGDKARYSFAIIEKGEWEDGMIPKKDDWVVFPSMPDPGRIRLLGPP